MTIGIILMIAGAALSAIGFIGATYYHLKLVKGGMHAKHYKRMEQWRLIGIGSWLIVLVGLFTVLTNIN